MTTQLTSDDPFSYVYTVLFELLTEHTEFNDLFSAGNLIRFDSDRLNPQKPNHEVSDLPECTLRPSGFSPAQSNSSNTQILLRYNLMLRTADWRVQRYGKVAWEAIRAWMLWKAKVNANPWPGNSQPIITDVWIENADVGQAENIATNNTTEILDGWSSLLQVNVRTNFITQEIKP